jgi:PTS system nitrogen regulatory IIA component
MLDLSTVLSQQRTLCRAQGVSKKRLFETLASVIGEDQPMLSVDSLYASLLAREKLGSTALGNGIAIPHCRISDCDRALGSLVTLADPIDFDAPDGQPVDILFVLLVPQEGHQEHLNLLAGLAELLSQANFCDGLRAADNHTDLYRAAVEFGA